MSLVTLDGNAVGLPKNFIENTYKTAFEQSVVGRLSGQTPMTLGDNIVPISNGGFRVGVVGEGQAKPVTKPTFGAKTITPIKVAGIVIVSDEVAKLNPAGMVTEIQSQMSNAISVAIDDLVLHGRNPLNGAPLANGLFGITSANGSQNKVELVGNDWKTAIYAAYDLAGADKDPNGLAIDTRSRTQISLTVQDVQYGLADLSSPTAVVAGLPAVYGRSVAKSANVDTGAKAIIGNWSEGLKYGFAESIEMKRSSDASIVDADGVTHNLFQENKTAFLIEAKIGWGITDPSAFAIITDAVEG